MDVWETIRIRCVRDREPQKRVARELGISKNTLKKYVRAQQPPRMALPDRASQVDRYRSQIDELLRTSPHITAKRIGTLLRERFGADVSIGERALRRYVARRRVALVPREAFVRATYAPGAQAQFDFTPVRALVAGVLVTLQLFVMRLSYSGRLFARVSWRCDQPALFAGILEALVAFGGVPLEGLFDNAGTAVVRVLRGRSREENEAFRAFCGALAFPISFAAPAKGNEKGGVEGANHYLQDNFFTPVPEFTSLTELNAALADSCRRDQEREHSVHHETIGARFAREEPALRALPRPLPRPCIVRPAHVNKFSEITLDGNRYSVPTRYAHRCALVEVYDAKLRVVVEGTAVAEHPRSGEKGQMFLDPRHFLELLAHKHRAAATAAVFADGRLPAAFLDLRGRYVLRDRQAGTKAWMSVVGLLHEHPLASVEAAITTAMARGTDDPAAIALLLRQRTRPYSGKLLSLATRPDIPRHSVEPVDLQEWALAGLAESAP
ncbi:MAG: IS21 family transposase [Vulcanimicrobiaceae bacterium]